MLEAGDAERALDFFLRSREAYASPQNTINAALCLERLGRFDESLEMYEFALSTLADKLDADDRAAIARASTTLLQKVANLQVSANTTGAVLIDGRERGKVPQAVPLRVLGGKHVVRIVKDGYRTYEATIDVKPGESARVDGKLEPLAAAGQLRIEDTTAEGAEVFVDGAALGKAPWEGTLGPGPHVVWSRSGDVGSAPTSVIVLQGQTGLIRLHSGPLGPTARITVHPSTAQIVLDGAPVGIGTFELRLPIGAYGVEAREVGYFPAVARFRVGADAAPARVSLTLAIDPKDPRWPQPIEVVPGHVWVGALGGVALGATLGSGAEAGCPSACADNPIVTGGLVGARAGYRFRFGTSMELTAAYLSLGLSSDRTRTAVFPTNAPRFTVHYDLHDHIRLSGPLLMVGASHRIPLLKWVHLMPRASVGVLLGHVRNPVTGAASTNAEPVRVQIRGAGDSMPATRVVLAPELGAVVPWRQFELGLALAVAIVPGDGPTFSQSTVEVAPSCSPTSPGAVGCAPSSSLLANERALGAFYVWVPQVTLGYVF